MTFVASIVPAPYVVQSVGPTVDVLGEIDGAPVISVEGRAPETTDGQLRLTTVAVQGSPGNSVQLPAVFMAFFDRTQAIVPVEALYPDTSDAVGTRLMNTVQMNSSQQEAIAAALEAQSIPYSTTVIIAGVRTDGPANGILEAGDVITGVNGSTADSVEGYVDLVASAPAENDVQMSVRRGSEDLTLAVPTVQEDGRTRMGVVLSQGFDFPVQVNFALESIGGPSAGLIFALGIYDEMTPGDLTGGQKIAGTGTIDEHGTVGPIGGIRQKLVGARDDGADYFLAPADNCPEVVGYVPDGLTVYSVSTFEEATLAVETIAGQEELPYLTTCTQ